MYLSELNIIGFKSFARKTTLVFHDGITGIVGPNGCGKSNIVDAIRWVMGEQRSGVLRSEVMGNVIFNGSATAKPVGMAEVSLKIENTKGILPVDYPEVVITRRLFRSGESVYMINGNPCRLKDILDLFVDTGAGPHTYSVIELQQVERILNGKEDERRRIFEEAAGITRYKLRRKATMRKLESTEKDLIRIEDIMSEVDKNVRTLRRQVAKAQRYQEIAVELRNLEIATANHEFSIWTRELEPIQAQLQQLRDEREKASAELAKEDATYEATRTQLLELEKKLSETQRIIHEIDQETQKFEERLLVNRERIRFLEETAVRTTKEREEYNTRLQEMRKQFAKVDQTTEQIRNSFIQKKEQQQLLQQEYETLRSFYEEKRALIRNVETQLLQITEALSKKQNEGERLKATGDNLNQRLKQLESEQANDNRRAEELSQQLAEEQKHEQDLLFELEATRKQLSQTQKHHEEARRLYDSLQKAEAQDRNAIEVKGHQTELLKRLIDTFEDYPSGVRFLAAQEVPGFKTFGPLANIIRVEAPYRNAIAAALADAATYLVVENRNMAFAGIALLKEEKKGIVSFLPYHEMENEKPSRPQVTDLGVIGWADEIVTYEERFKPVVQAILSAFLVVQDMQTAQRVYDLLKRHHCHVVTLTGEVLGYTGILRGGLLSKNQSGYIGRLEQLDALQKELQNLQQSIEKRQIQKQNLATEIQEKTILTEELTKRIKEIEEQIATVRLILGRYSFEQQALEQAKQKRDKERQQLLEEINILGQSLELQATSADDLQTKRHQLAQEAEDLHQHTSSLEKELELAGKKVQEISLEVAKFQSELEAYQREKDGWQRQMEEMASVIHSREEEAIRAKNEIEELIQVNKHYSKEIAEKNLKRQALQQILADLEEQQFATNTQVAESEKIIRAARQRFEQLSEAVHQLELRASELNMRLETLRSRMWTEFDYKIQAQPIDPEFKMEEAKQQIEILREKIKEMGPVNLLALREYEQEKERLDFLQAQRDDLIKARKNLNETIDLINATARQKFIETFNQVEKNFTKVFSTFFPGGKATLTLQETDDPLEAEIEILANPGGKKLSSLSLLSGGEKTLTAISLLFAIYLVKPSPFCIFDEVDAPMDDQNVGRFNRALREFAKNTQFIIVTHNKLTMRAADQLYGITMEEQGISKVVSVKFSNNDKEPLVAEKSESQVSG